MHLDTATAVNMNTTAEEVSNFTDLIIDKWAEDIDCNHLTSFLYLDLLPLVAGFGVIGNSIIFIVLCLETQNSVSRFLLRIMAVCETLFLVFATTCLTFQAAMTRFNPFDPFNEFSEYMVVYLYPVVHTTQMLGIWSTVLLAVNRYIAICWPYRAPHWCTMKTVRREVAFMVIGVIFYNIPRWFEFRRETDPETNITRAMTNIEHDLYIKLYQIAGYGIFVFCIPLAVLIFCYVALCKDRWQARNRLSNHQLPNADEDERNLTSMMISILSAFFSFQAPALFNNVLKEILDKNYVCGGPAYTFYHVSNFLACVNSALNFLWYCMIRHQFQTQLQTCCGSCFAHFWSCLKRCNPCHLFPQSKPEYSTHSCRSSTSTQVSLRLAEV